MPDIKTSKVPRFSSYISEPDNHAKNESPLKFSSKKNKIPGETEKNVTTRHCSHSLGNYSPSLRESNSLQGHQNENPARIFVVDRKGDEKNLIYGSLHKYNVPRYHQYGDGQVLGAPANLRIGRVIEDEKCVFLTHVGSHKNHSRDKHIFSKILHKRPQLFKIRRKIPGVNKVPNQLDFISLEYLPHSKRHTVGDEKNIKEFQNDENQISGSFLSTETNLNLDPDIEDSNESGSEDSNHGQTIDGNSSFRRKNALLSRNVEENPDDIEAWLSLIDHQESLTHKNDENSRITQAMVRSTADIKIHMYEKALKNSKSLENRERLLIGLMSDGEKIWEIKTQASRWEKISKDNIDSHVLWTKFVNFKQSSLSIFRYEDVKKVYLQRIRFLSEVAKKGNVNIQKTHSEILYVLLRATLFIRESGYSELAIAIWQGILEINFCRPKQNLLQDEYFSLFKDFWENEAPRIGEEGSNGWRYHLNTQGKSDQLEPLVDKTMDFLIDKNLFESWASAEKNRSRESKVPAKTLDDVVEDDPFRVILFTDIQDFLYILPKKSNEIYRSCIDAFLIFCRLPRLADIDNDQNERFDDSFIIEGPLRSELSWLESTQTENSQETNDHEILQTSLPISNFTSSPESLFSGVTGLQDRPNPYRERFPEDNGPVPYRFIRNTLQLLTKNWNDETLNEYYLSFEYLNEPETIKKISKEILKQSPSSFRLYHAYALIEHSRGNKKIAEGIFMTALNMIKSIEHCEVDTSHIMLWKSWIWISLEDKNCFSALKYLLCIVDGAPDLTINISPATILRAKQYLILKGVTHLSKNTVFAVMHSECLAILEYLSCNHGENLSQITQRDITSAMKIFESSSERLRERKQIKFEELILQSASRLLFYHCKSGSYRPALIREYLESYLQRFPKNSMFLSFYRWNESRLRNDNRFRNILLGTILLPHHDTLTSRLFSIQYEIKNGTVHSVKAAFDHATSSIATRYSASLWQFFILYCLRIKVLRDQAKSVWYRSLRVCPWVKELYIFGFEKFGNLVDFKELKGAWKIMEEKELRVHVALEDELDDYESLKK